MQSRTLVPNLLSLAVVSALALGLSACGGDDHKTVAEPAMPSGSGSTLTVAAPDSSYPLPVIDNAANNSNSDTRYSVEQNPISRMLSGINKLWYVGESGWQTNANGNGPDSFDGQQIVDAQLWQENIQYVIDVTNQRNSDQAVLAFLDDQRSKNYSVIDGLGPLTEAYVTASGAYTDIHAPTRDEVLNDGHYYAAHNDGISYAGDTNSELGAVVALVEDFRQHAPASTSASKYTFSTPRPWRMDSTGAVAYLGSATYSCEDRDDNSSHSDWIFDNYTSSVSVVPGLMCARRHHKSSIIADNQENRRKDGGYPSGHTNAGYLAAMAYAYALPQRFSEMLTRASQLGEDRILAGMHSPVDVIGGRMHALAVAAYALGQTEIQANAQTAYQQAQDFFGTRAAVAGQSLYEYAHNHVTNETGMVIGNQINTEVFNNNTYADHQANKALYRQRLTYGFTQDSSKAGQDPVVPAGAERLLASRLPYLSAEQRRQVLYTTEVDSGYPLLDESNGWGRLDLVTAADGYGALLADVTVTMNASERGFNAQDWWRNDISGTGMLTKAGTGSLGLTGNNSYSGGTVINGGTLVAMSTTALGNSDVYVATGGSLAVNSAGTVNVSGNLTLKGGDLALVMDNDASQIAATGTVWLDDASLTLDMSAYANGADNLQLTLVQGADVAGEFSQVTAAGYQVNLNYHHDSVVAELTKD